MATKAELKARLSLDTALFERGIHLAHAGTQRLGSAFTSVGSIGVAAWTKIAAGLAALGGAAGFVKGVHGALELGSSLKEMSDRTGIAVSKLVVLQEAFKEAGLEAEDVGAAINKMQRFIEKAGPEKLGQAFFVLRQMRPEDQFQLLARVISQMPSASERAAAAMEAFGKGGGKLLQVFAESGAMGEIQEAIGKQADLLGQNAQKFDEVADHLKRIGTQFRGFFVGVAAGVVDFIKPFIDKMSGIDFTGVGKKFGEALTKGAEAVIGFFKNPELLFYAVKEGFKAALMEGANVLIAIFKAAIEFFRTGLVSMFVGLGDTIIGVLLQAFAKPVAYFQAMIEAALAKIPKALGGTDEAAQAKEQYTQLTKMLTAVDQARDKAFAKSQEDPFGQKAQTTFTNLQEQRDKLFAALPQDPFSEAGKAARANFLDIQDKRDKAFAELTQDPFSAAGRQAQATLAQLQEQQEKAFAKLQQDPFSEAGQKARATFFEIQKQRDKAFAELQKDPFGQAGEKARKAFTELQAQHEKLMAQRTALEPAMRGQLPTVEERAQRIMAQPGGPLAGIFETKTAQQYLDEGSKKLGDAFDAAATALKNLKVEDVMGAGKVLANTMLATQVAIQQGEEFFRSGMGGLIKRQAGPGESQALIDEIEANRVRFEKQLRGEPTGTPIEKWRADQAKAMEDYNAWRYGPPGTEGAKRFADAQMEALRLRFEEQPLFIPPAMKRDIFRPGAIMGAFGVEGARGLGGPMSIMSERHARREAWLRDKAERGAKDSLTRTNTFLDQIQRNTLETAQAWE